MWNCVPIVLMIVPMSSEQALRHRTECVDQVTFDRDLNVLSLEKRLEFFHGSLFSFLHEADPIHLLPQSVPVIIVKILSIAFYKKTAT